MCLLAYLDPFSFALLKMKREREKSVPHLRGKRKRFIEVLAAVTFYLIQMNYVHFSWQRRSVFSLHRNVGTRRSNLKLILCGKESESKRHGS
jgi:hypothetical protein